MVGGGAETRKEVSLEPAEGSMRLGRCGTRNGNKKDQVVSLMGEKLRVGDENKRPTRRRATEGDPRRS